MAVYGQTGRRGAVVELLPGDVVVVVSGGNVVEVVVVRRGSVVVVVLAVASEPHTSEKGWFSASR